MKEFLKINHLLGTDDAIKAKIILKTFLSFRVPPWIHSHGMT